jgi:hypothetical protein
VGLEESVFAAEMALAEGALSNDGLSFGSTLVRCVFLEVAFACRHGDDSLKGRRENDCVVRNGSVEGVVEARLWRIAKSRGIKRRSG